MSFWMVLTCPPFAALCKGVKCHLSLTSTWHRNRKHCLLILGCTFHSQTRAFICASEIGRPSSREFVNANSFLAVVTFSLSWDTACYDSSRRTLFFSCLTRMSMRSVQPCSAATCTAVRWSVLRIHEGHPMLSRYFTASALFHAAAQYSGVHSSLSFTSGSQPCVQERDTWALRLHETARMNIVAQVSMTHQRQLITLELADCLPSMEFREACRVDACSKSDYQAFEDPDGLYVPLSSRDVQGRGSHIVLDTGWTARLYQETYCINLRRQSPTHDLQPLLSLKLHSAYSSQIGRTMSTERQAAAMAGCAAGCHMSSELPCCARQHSAGASRS